MKKRQGYLKTLLPWTPEPEGQSQEERLKAPKERGQETSRFLRKKALFTRNGEMKRSLHLLVRLLGRQRTFLPKERGQETSKLLQGKGLFTRDGRKSRGSGKRAFDT